MPWDARVGRIAHRNGSGGGGCGGHNTAKLPALVLSKLGKH